VTVLLWYARAGHAGMTAATACTPGPRCKWPTPSPCRRCRCQPPRRPECRRGRPALESLRLGVRVNSEVHWQRGSWRLGLVLEQALAGAVAYAGTGRRTVESGALV
jgi:hypothetical protein